MASNVFIQFLEEKPSLSRRSEHKARVFVKAALSAINMADPVTQMTLGRWGAHKTSILAFRGGLHFHHTRSMERLEAVCD